LHIFWGSAHIFRVRVTSRVIFRVENFRVMVRVNFRVMGRVSFSVMGRGTVRVRVRVRVRVYFRVEISKVGKFD